MIEVDIEHVYSPSARTVRAKFSSDARVLGLFGKSGSGKTTVVNAIAGLLKPTRGRILIDGETWFASESNASRNAAERAIGYVFQEGLLFPHMSVRQNLLYGANRGAKPQATHTPLTLESVAENLGIESLLNRRPHELSGGEQQRVAIGRALLSKPQLLLMDEPLAGIDTNRRSEILALIERVRDRYGIRIIYVSHSIGEITRLTDEVALMSEGECIACGRTEEIFNRSDLRPITGRYEGGALIEATAVAHDTTYFLTTFRFGETELVAPGLEVPIGARVRLRIRARDVTLATERPHGISVRNILEGTIVAMDDRGGAIVEVITRVGEHTLPARISRQARDEMSLAVDQRVYLLVKAIAFDKRSMGYAG